MLAQTVTPPSKSNNLGRALAQMETYFNTPKEPEAFELFFREECLSLKEKIRSAVLGKLNELPGPVCLMLKGTCCLSGGAISSIYHGETPKDFDLWAKDEKAIKTIEKELELKDFSYIRTGDDASEYDGMKENLHKGKFVTKNAITLKNRVQFILLSDLQTARAEFDFIHCLPYYDLSENKLFISKTQFAAIRHKQLIANNQSNVTKKRIDKFRDKGWNLR